MERNDKDRVTMPIRQPRQGWKQAFDRMHEAADDTPIFDGLTNEFDNS